MIAYLDYNPDVELVLVLGWYLGLSLVSIVVALLIGAAGIWTGWKRDP